MIASAMATAIRWRAADRPLPFSRVSTAAFRNELDFDQAGPHGVACRSAAQQSVVQHPNGGMLGLIVVIHATGFSPRNDAHYSGQQSIR